MSFVRTVIALIVVTAFACQSIPAIARSCWSHEALTAPATPEERDRLAAEVALRLKAVDLDFTYIRQRPEWREEVFAARLQYAGTSGNGLAC